MQVGASVTGQSSRASVSSRKRQLSMKWIRLRPNYKFRKSNPDVLVRGSNKVEVDC